jgi:hypothetical protein
LYHHHNYPSRDTLTHSQTRLVGSSDAFTNAHFDAQKSSQVSVTTESLAGTATHAREMLNDEVDDDDDDDDDDDGGGDSDADDEELDFR